MHEAENAHGPRAVGRYRLYEPIAAGGMATVHHGRMLGPLGFARTVAIKRLHREYARDPEFVAMFRDEARLAARVQHPNVVQTLDVVLSEGELFVVMEYVPAASLAELLEAARGLGQRLPAGVAAAIVKDVLEGLHAAHEATDERGDALDVVHRDVSPQNVLVGADGRARVLDFGIAKAAGRAGQVTREGQVKGKLSYMSPEQITSVGVSRQSDVFAAAIVLWEALTGARLFSADSGPALIARVLSGPIEPPSRHAPGIGPELDAVVLRGLARDRSLRYATGRDMARELEASTPLASASQVGEWVERLAGEGLATRAARVAQIESESSAEPARGASEPPAPSAADGAPEARDAGAAPAPQGGRRGRTPLIAGAVLGAAAVAALLAGRLSRQAGAAGPSTHTTTLASAAESAAPLASAPPAPPSSAAPADSAVDGHGPPPTEPKAAPARQPLPSLPSLRSRPAQPGCDPPYYVDSRGHVIYRPECFR